jgi:hypothetical protein
MSTATAPQITDKIIAGDRSLYFVKLISAVMKVAKPLISIHTPIVLACMLPRGVIPLLTPIVIAMRHKRKIISNPMAYLPSMHLGIFFSLYLFIFNYCSNAEHNRRCHSTHLTLLKR